VTWDVDARPSLEEVLAVRRERDATLREVMLSLSEEELAREVTRHERGWPQLEDYPVRRCLRTILNEEWEHRRYAERDLDVLEAASQR